MRFVSFSSGSSGNCTLLDSDTTHLLVDVGISRKKTIESLAKMDLGLSDINGIFITHEHTDHISGLRLIAQKTKMPIYATQGTINAILKMPESTQIDPERFIAVKPDEKLTVGDITACPIHISHDAADPVGYRFRCGTKKACVCTDLGCFNDYTAACLKNSDVVLLEANHDVNMLETGPYPYPLKRRIMSEQGHLSNANTGELLCRVLNDHMKAIFLGHLSQENNLPELAYETVRLEIMGEQTEYRADELPIHIARRRDMSQAVEW